MGISFYYKIDSVITDWYPYKIVGGYAFFLKIGQNGLVSIPKWGWWWYVLNFSKNASWSAPGWYRKLVTPPEQPNHATLQALINV